MTVALQELYSFVYKFVQLSSCGINADLSLICNEANISVKMNASLGDIQLHQLNNAPPYEQPRTTKPSRIRRRRRRKAIRENQPDDALVNEVKIDRPDTSNEDDWTEDFKNDILSAYEADPSSKCKNVLNQTAASTKPDLSTYASSQSISLVTPGYSKQTFEDVMQFDPLAPSLPYQLQDGFKPLSSPPTSNPMQSLEVQSTMLALLEDINRRM